jgi:hypothetical protein
MVRRTKLFRMVRGTAIMHEYVRPAYSRASIREWWRNGRPAPPPHEVKMCSILYLADRIGASALIETGSYLGDTIRALRGRFDLLASIEISPELAAPLIEEFKDDRHVRVIVGDSGAQLKTLVPTIMEPTVFWLDAHYCGGNTAGGEYVPIYAELDSIWTLNTYSHAIVIDDMKDFDGNHGYPAQSNIVNVLTKRGYEVACFNNMLHALFLKRVG